MNDRHAIDWIGPLPPLATGVADYSEEILTPLRETHDIRIVSEGPTESQPDAGAYSSYVPEEGRLRVYQIGNHRAFHGAAYDLALRHPGLVVLHEYGLWDLVRETALGHSQAAWREELDFALGPRIAADLESRSPAVRPPLFERLVDSSLGVIVHSEAARTRVLASRPGARIWKVPHHFDARATLREPGPRFDLPGIGPQDFVVGVFGTLAPSKKVDVVLEAFARLAETVPNAHLVLVGEPADRHTYEALFASPPAQVHPTGRVGLHRMKQLISAVDVAVNLRLGTAGETSGTCMRLLGAGTATIVNDVGWFSEIPDDACIKIADDPYETAVLAGWLQESTKQPALLGELGQRAAAWIAEEHSLARTVEAYSGLLDEVVGGRPGESRVPLPYLSPNAESVGAGDLECAAAVAIGSAMSALGFDSPAPRTQATAELDGSWLDEVAGLSHGIGLG